MSLDGQKSRWATVLSHARRVHRRAWSMAGWGVLSVVVLLCLLVGGFALYSTTQDFQRRVSVEAVALLENATGGRVDVAGVHFNLRHLAVEMDGLIIHGLEGPGEAPYLSAAKIEMRVKLFNLFQHTTGTGLRSHVSLDYLSVERPQVHLIVYKDGKTNQPVPKHPMTSKQPLTDTLLDLKAKKVVLADGVVQLNDEAIPFGMDARDLNIRVSYVAAGDMYGATIDLNDLRMKMAAEAEARSTLHVEVMLGRDRAELRRLDFKSGNASELVATGSLSHFVAPVWQVKLKGSMELPQLTLLTGVDTFTGGSVDVDVNGHSCVTSPAVAQKHPRFWQRLHRPKQQKPSMTVLPPDPDCQAGYLMVGSAKLHDAGFKNEYVRVAGVNGGAQLHITPTDLLFTALTGYLPDGGRAEGRLRVSNWLGEVPASGPPASPTMKAAVSTANTTAKSIGAKTTPLEAKRPVVDMAKAYLDVIVSKLSVRTILDATAPVNYGDLGFDTAVSGPVTVEWGGPATDIADTVQADGNLRLAPLGAKRRGSLSNVPVAGQFLAHYDGKTETVAVQKMMLQTPQSTLEGSGTLGVNLGDRLTLLRVDMTVRDLSEYDQLLHTLAFTVNGKTGRAAIPVLLHGALQFTGTARGEIADLDMRGHLIGDNMEAQLGTAADMHIDTLVADGEYAPNEGLAVASSTIRQGSAVLNVTGTMRPRKEVARGHIPTYIWDEGTAIGLKAQLADGQVAELLKIAGQQESVSLTGIINMKAQAVGTLRDPVGSGQISMVKGTVYGEPYESAAADVAVRGREIELSQAELRLHGVELKGNGGYNTATQAVHGHVQGNDLVLSKFVTVQQANAHVDGVLDLTADAKGTMTQPNLKAEIRLASLTYQGQAVGQMSADVHTEGETAYLNSNATLLDTKLEVAGKVALIGSYNSEAKLTFSGLNLDKPLGILAPDKFTATSAIGGVVTVRGPLKQPKQLSGQAELNNVDVKLEGVELRSPEPLRLGLQGGVMTLEQVHITGQDTDLHASGTAQVFGATDPNGGKLDVKSTGSVSVALLHSFYSDILASGRVAFSVAAGGQIRKPVLTGDVQFSKVNLAMDGVSNGLTDMNGTLAFNQDRLQVQNLTAQTGGGVLKLGGSIRYSGGIYADLTATGDAVRVRYKGLSTTANANLRLQGSPQNALFSGTILITRFGIGPDLDFAAFAGGGVVSPPPDPNAPTNKIRLDVHVTSSPQLDFQNSYAKLAGTVNLTVRGTVSEPAVLGTIQITDGSATFAGTKYQLQRGEIYFSNPVRIDPVIDLDATARVETYDITIGLHGTLTNMKPTYRSEPPLSESDVFALLALGRTQEEAQLYQEQESQQGTDPTTSSLLGGALNATVSNRVEKLFGVGSVKIDPAFVGTLGGSAARITVQQQLSRQLTATYATNVNTQAQQLIQLEYDVNHNVSILATRDEAGVFSVVYKLRRRYR